jgi:hypothetical protein
MRKSSVLFLAVIGICVIAGGCKKKPDYQPSKLMGDLTSGLSVRGAQHALDTRPTQWETLDDRRSFSGVTPEWHEVVIVKKNFSAYGQTGDIVLSFFNEELVSAQFYPVDIVAAKEAVSVKDKVGFTAQGDAHTSIATRVWIGKDQDGRSYIGWIDKTRQAVRDKAFE